jgi:hypothetical protein
MMQRRNFLQLLDRLTWLCRCKWLAIKYRTMRLLRLIDRSAYEGRTRFEVNVAMGGHHLLATDSLIRWYSPEQIAYMVVTLKEAFPTGNVSVTTWGKRSPLVEAAITGELDKNRLSKSIGKLKKMQDMERETAGYAGGAAPDYREADAA